MFTRRAIPFSSYVWLCCYALSISSALAIDWKLYRFEGRDYVALDQVATFYSLPPPPAVTVAPRVLPSAPSPPVAEVPATSSPAPGTAPAAAPASAPPLVEELVVTGPRTFTLDSGKALLEVTLNSREVIINGAKHWLAFPVRLQDSKVVISRIDLSKILEPQLRPEHIAGLQPVTTVVLDPGHGGHDRGAISRYGFEKDFALDVALRARPLLEKRGFKVAMTRTTDVFIPLEQRPTLANQTPNSIFVSIHFNSTSTNPLARGFEIFSIAPRGAPATNDPAFSARDLREEPGNAMELPSAALASSIYHSLLGQVPTIDRGLKHARFAVLRRATVPAVLVECGFVSNGPESALIGQPAWRHRVAEAIVEGVENYKGLAMTKTAPRLIADYRRAAPSGVGLRDSLPPQVQPAPPAPTTAPQ
jgi:N-acetylmuramoyl-L-alanine amidase